ncbi:hypothetical protein CYMTET_8052 [Cymbomonas tetramitiformis]|uniref:Uncharacterized protein n=1 Tax=Cymbomonas tetramitiformis TaxID=36881 RepID=A0AAE0GTZ2_9CHLO|nr:hypothetical protein CYMTET_8052 [Cymbomonas tetramitiformis]
MAGIEHHLAAQLHIDLGSEVNCSSNGEVLRWQSGDIVGSGTVELDTWKIENNNRLQLDGVTVTLSGNTTWTGLGLIFVANGAHIINSANSTFDMQTDAFIFGNSAANASSAVAIFTNAGHVTKSKGYAATGYITAEYVSAGGTVDWSVVFSGNIDDPAYKPRLWSHPRGTGCGIAEWSDALNWLPPRVPSADAVVYIEKEGLQSPRTARPVELNPGDSARTASSSYENHTSGMGYNRGRLDSPAGWRPSPSEDSYRGSGKPHAGTRQRVHVIRETRTEQATKEINFTKMLTLFRNYPDLKDLTTADGKKARQ